ncbi:TPA: type II secretion system minor pseudopilin GspK [Raoultella planticola]
MRRQQQGVALLMILLILTIMATLVASVVERNGRTYLRTVTHLEYQQAKWYVRAAEAMSGNILQRDMLDSPQKTHLAQNWAQAKHQFTFEGGEVRGQIVDAQACFNLNAINQGATDPNSTPYPARVFMQLLKNLQVEPVQAAQVTAAVRDWIDSDNEPLTGGAEDEVYMAREEPYLPANQLMKDISELRTISGVDASLYRRLVPYVCVLPTSTLLLNINTLRESQNILLSSLFLTELDANDATKLLQGRPREGWDSVATFLALPQLKDIDTAAVKPLLAVKSDFFLTHFRVLMGSSYFSQHSLLQWRGEHFHMVQSTYGSSTMVVP